MAKRKQFVDKPWVVNPKSISEAAEEKRQKVRNLIERAKLGNKRPATHELQIKAQIVDQSCQRADSIDYSALTQAPSVELRGFVNLLDALCAERGIHIGLFWPFTPVKAILPWALRELGRGPGAAPLRTLFMNMGRAALQSLTDLEAKTEKLRELGVHRSGQADPSRGVQEIPPDAHVYMFLGNSKAGTVPTLPISSILPHTVAIDDGVYWRDFDEKALKGFKRYYPENRLNAIRNHLGRLTSFRHSPSFAFLLPGHFESKSRRNALSLLGGNIDLIVVDATVQALGGRETGIFLQEILKDIESQFRKHAPPVLLLTDCPLRYSYLRQAAIKRKSPGYLGTQVRLHRLIWSSRERGFSPLHHVGNRQAPIVETLGSNECLVASRLLAYSKEVGDDAPELSRALLEGAIALKSMALAATGADILLAPYNDTHDAYHRAKREKHSFIPHYNKICALLGSDQGAAKRSTFQQTLDEGLQLALQLVQSTPLGRYVEKALESSSGADDVLIVLRYPEDVQQAREKILDTLTEPGRFTGPLPEVRLTTPARYEEEVCLRLPSRVIWAASPLLGLRAYVGDHKAANEFRLIVGGQDSAALKKHLEAALNHKEFLAYYTRAKALLNALPGKPKEYGGLTAAFSLDLDRPRRPLPFGGGGGYLELDGFGKVPAGPNSTFYVLDPATQRLVIREARSLEEGDGVFIMSDAIREEIEGILREKNEMGRTFEQALVDHYKSIVQKGATELAEREGQPLTASRVREILYERYPHLPPISTQAVDYWLKAADAMGTDTPHAAQNPEHFQAFIELMGGGVTFTEQLVRAVKVVRAILRRDGHVSRAMFDMLLLDPDSLIQRTGAGFQRLEGLRREATDSIYPVLRKSLEKTNSADDKTSKGGR